MRVLSKIWNQSIICACFRRFKKTLPYGYVYTSPICVGFYKILIFLPNVYISPIYVDLSHICIFVEYLIFGQNQGKKKTIIAKTNNKIPTIKRLSWSFIIIYKEIF